MWLRIIICLIFVLSAFSESIGQYVKKGKLPLFVTTETNYALADWDTAFAVISDSVGSLVDTVGLSHAKPGRWRGSYDLSSLLGNYIVEYFAIYTGTTDTTPGQPYFFSVNDTTAFFGGASGLSAEDVAEAVKCTATVHPEIWTDQVGGTGSYKDTIIVLDEDTNTVEGVSITVRNLSGTPVAYGLTDVDGRDILNLDASTYTFSLQRTGVIQDEDATLTITGNQTDTIWVTSYDPGDPPPPVTVYGFVDTMGLGNNRIQVSCTIHKEELRCGTKLLAYYSYTKTVYANRGGYWEMSLYSNEDITPTGTQYEFVIKTPSQQIIKKWVTVPTPGPWEFTW